MATDPIIKDHQLWIGFVQPEGLVVSPAALKNAQAVLSRNIGSQQEILRRHAVPDFHGNLRLKDFPAFTREFWGWREADLATPPLDLSARLPEYGETLRPTWVVRGGPKQGSGAQPEPLILVEELPWGTDLDKPGTASPQHETDAHRWHASPQARFERLLRATGVAIGLLISPQRIRLVYAPKGESSGHVTFPIHQMTIVAIVNPIRRCETALGRRIDRWECLRRLFETTAAENGDMTLHPALNGELSNLAES